MKIRLFRPWRQYAAGAVLDPPPNVADLLVNRRHLAEYVVDSGSVATLVPDAPGIGQAVGAIGQTLQRRKGR